MSDDDTQAGGNTDAFTISPRKETLAIERILARRQVTRPPIWLLTATITTTVAAFVAIGALYSYEATHGSTSTGNTTHVIAVLALGLASIAGWSLSTAIYLRLRDRADSDRIDAYRYQLLREQQAENLRILLNVIRLRDEPQNDQRRWDNYADLLEKRTPEGVVPMDRFLQTSQVRRRN
ncbi:hypothetical protein AB0B63_07450 [Micromonospora sp. NPDC049081]|uniref:hypothetical protein n=1 Tax=Micromonospora sp. NPDC049081 TaxID=3155150 RepID=UPI0033C3BCFB